MDACAVFRSRMSFEGAWDALKVESARDADAQLRPIDELVNVQLG